MFDFLFSSLQERKRSSGKIDFARREERRRSVIKNDNERIRKIRQMVNFEENHALSENQKKIHGIIDEE